uniref:C-type lectin domain-containing protein n=1 Tax=Maylandia zebra TaxID=106582 RepID=A0A3P9D0Y8_9CICH
PQPFVEPYNLLSSLSLLIECFLLTEHILCLSYFCILGQGCLFTCRLYEYHFIAENKSWSEAQTYCREEYTDLAKVFDMTDMSRLRNSAQNQGEAWIGLKNDTGGNRTWRWSLPGVEYIHNDSSWNLNGRQETEPGPGNCGRKRDKLVDVSCDSTMWFICYDGEEM